MSLLLGDLLSKLQGASDTVRAAAEPFLDRYRPYFPEISHSLYEHLPMDDRQRFVIWMFKRWGGIDFIDPVELVQYNKMVNCIRNQACTPLLLNGRDYKIQDLRPQGYAFELAIYDWVLNIHDVYYNQYEHKHLVIKSGDVIVDAGGFVGDTAALFCHKVKGDCVIHSFELLQENIQLFRYNLELNGIADRVRLNRLALSERSDEVVGVLPAAMQGATRMSADSSLAEQVPTITLDDYVQRHDLSKLDLVKMDIEGAEVPALNGAQESIRRFRPRLAICIYHKWDDVITIPRSIAQTGVEYAFFFKWVQLTHGWEAILFADPL